MKFPLCSLGLQEYWKLKLECFYQQNHTDWILCNKMCSGIPHPLGMLLCLYYWWPWLVLLVFTGFLSHYNYKHKWGPSLLFALSLKSQTNVSKGPLLDKHYDNYYRESFFPVSKNNIPPPKKKKQMENTNTGFSEIHFLHEPSGNLLTISFFISKARKRRTVNIKLLFQETVGIE